MKSLSDYVNNNDLYLNRFEKSYDIEDLDTLCYTKYHIGQNLTKEEVINLFNEISAHKSNKGYYVGITCDRERREREHNAEFLAVIECPSLEKANELEKLLDKEGFETGDATGNGHKLSTKKVYIYRMIPNVTKE